jgi:hypothetical protein
MAKKDGNGLPKQTLGSTKTEASIMVVLDRSGSMASVREATIDGFNQFLADQAKLPGCRFSLTQFDSDGIDDVHVDRPAADVRPLDGGSYQPRAATPLYDAVGRSIKMLDARQPKGKVIFCIITDGYENASHEYTQKAVLDLVTAKRAEGWEFVFMGANIDAYAAGGALGVPGTSTYGYASTGASTQAAFSNVSHSTTMFRSGMMSNVNMPDHDTADPSYKPGQAAGASPWTSTPGTAPRSSTVKVKTKPLPVSRLGSTK